MIVLYPRLRIFPEKTDIKFMKGRFAGLALSAQAASAFSMSRRKLSGVSVGA